ncbi:SDR family NAD(P)-dependent oxidoreductase [Chloroflexota bacterium]
MEQSKEKGILSKFSLEDRVAIVTGSGSGLGKGIALAFAQDGAHIVVAELDASKGKATAEEVRALGRKALPIATDVLDSEQVKVLVDKTVAEFGRIDILVNNVGGTPAKRAPVVFMPEDVWDGILNLNLKGTFLCSRAVSRVMMDQGSGNIINISSRAGLMPFPSQAPYGVAKAGIVNFTGSLALQLAPYHIRVNAIAPTMVATRNTGHHRYLGDMDERVQKRGVPLGRVGRVEDIALAAIYLASDASDYVTGITIPVMGGPYLGGKMLEEAQDTWQITKSP